MFDWGHRCASSTYVCVEVDTWWLTPLSKFQRKKDALPIPAWCGERWCEIGFGVASKLSDNASNKRDHCDHLELCMVHQN